MLCDEPNHKRSNNFAWRAVSVTKRFNSTQNNKNYRGFRAYQVSLETCYCHQKFNKMSQRKSKGYFWDSRFKMRRRRHRLKKEINGIPETERRSIKQVLREYRDRRSTGSLHNVQRSTGNSKSYKTINFENSNLSHAGNYSGPEIDQKVNYKRSSAPVGGPELTYREEPSTESFVMRNLPRERSVVISHFEPLKIHLAETKSAPECVASQKSYNETFRHLHEPSLLNFETTSKTKNSQESVRAYFHNNTGNYNQHFAPRSDTGTVSAESVISSTPSDHKVVPEKSGNGVMKKIESSILSFFGFGSTKESSMRKTNKSQGSTEPTSDRIMSFFSYKSTNGINKWDFPTNAATEEIDYSIYGSHAKYYM